LRIISGDFDKSPTVSLKVTNDRARPFRRVDRRAFHINQAVRPDEKAGLAADPAAGPDGSNFQSLRKFIGTS